VTNNRTAGRRGVAIPVVHRDQPGLMSDTQNGPVGLKDTPHDWPDWIEVFAFAMHV